MFFIAGFLLALWQIEYWQPIYYATIDRRPMEDRARAELDRLRKMAFELSEWSVTEKKKEEALNEREARIVVRENSLKIEEQTLDKLKKEIADLQTRLDARIVLIQAAQEANNQQLAKLYSAMTAESAAAILAPMEEDQIAQILRKMKETKSAKILEVWGAKTATVEKAANITRKMRSAVVENAEETK